MRNEEISFKASNEDFDKIDRIANEAVAAFAKAGVEYPKLEALMDLAAVHANGCPLRLDDMLAAASDEDGRGDFGHDIAGIRRHLDRGTGKLGDFFVPRFARPEAD